MTEAQIVGLVVFVIMLVFLIIAVGAISSFHQMSVKSEELQAEANALISKVRD